MCGFVLESKTNRESLIVFLTVPLLYFVAQKFFY